MAPAATHTSVPRAGLTCSPNPSPTWKTISATRKSTRWAAILALVGVISLKFYHQHRYQDLVAP